MTSNCGKFILHQLWRRFSDSKVQKGIYFKQHVLFVSTRNEVYTVYLLYCCCSELRIYYYLIFLSINIMEVKYFYFKQKVVMGFSSPIIKCTMYKRNSSVSL
jgi:hypothetical protein